MIIDVVVVLLLLLLLVELHNVMSAAEPYRQSACYQIHSTCVNGPALKLLVIIVIKIKVSQKGRTGCSILQIEAKIYKNVNVLVSDNANGRIP